jgi:predicted DNA-binding protein (UPF0251 family)
MRKAEEVHVTGVSLTADEIRALQYAANGLTEHQAAQRFGISHRSYRRLLSSACEKLAAANITHAVAIAVTLRLIGAGTLPPPDDGSAERLAEIEKRCAAATEGPWSAYDEDPEYGRLYYYGDFGWYVKGPAGSPELDDNEQGQADAAFIAHAREDVPFLLEQIRRLTTS